MGLVPCVSCQPGACLFTNVYQRARRSINCKNPIAAIGGPAHTTQLKNPAIFSIILYLPHSQFTPGLRFGQLGAASMPKAPMRCSRKYKNNGKAKEGPTAKVAMTYAHQLRICHLSDSW